MAVCERDPRWGFVLAVGPGYGAPRGECAALREGSRIGGVAWKRDNPLPGIVSKMEAGDRAEQAFRIGVLRALEDKGRGARFDDLPCIQDGNPILWLG